MNPSPVQASSHTARFALAIAECLDDLSHLLRRATPAQYADRGNAQFMHASMGGHVRHCLDHIAALVDGVAKGLIDYDHRLRGTPVELDPSHALQEIARLRTGLERVSADHGDRRVAVLCMPGRSCDALPLESTLSREMAFVLSHTIHHQATLRGMCVSLGLETCDSFGYAPSTLAHQDARCQAHADHLVIRKDATPCAR